MAADISFPIRLLDTEVVEQIAGYYQIQIDWEELKTEYLDGDEELDSIIEASLSFLENYLECVWYSDGICRITDEDMSDDDRIMGIESILERNEIPYDSKTFDRLAEYRYRPELPEKDRHTRYIIHPRFDGPIIGIKNIIDIFDSCTATDADTLKKMIMKNFENNFKVPLLDSYVKETNEAYVSNGLDRLRLSPVEQIIY